MYHVYKITLIADSLNAQIVDAYFYLLTVLLNDCELRCHMPHISLENIVVQQIYVSLIIQSS